MVLIFEEQWGIIYLSRALLTLSLIPLLKKAGTSGHYSRIVDVSSSGHLAGKINFDDVNTK